MQLTTIAKQPNQTKTDILAVLLFSGKNQLKESIKFLPAKLRLEALKIATKAKFKSKAKQILTLPTHGQVPAFLIVLIGLGGSKQSANKIVEGLREANALLSQTATKYQAQKIGLILSNKIFDLLKPETLGQACAVGLKLGTYKFKKYKKAKKKPDVEIKEVIFFKNGAKFKKGLKLGKILSNGVILARDLVNEPPGVMTPDELLNIAKKLAQKSKLIKLKSFFEKQLKGQGFGGLAAISQGSGKDAHLIHLIYRPKSQRKFKKVALVGKGITFDSGGLSIKPYDYMENMKTDMAGAAAVLGIFEILTRLKPQIEVHGIIAACENMSGKDAIKPGDIIKIKNGKTVEILNTDAEGRIILADAISYAVEQKPDKIIDLATLTGACIAALGGDIAGILGNNQKLIDRLLAAGSATGEKIWQLPLEPQYNKTLKSDLADLRNISKMKGGGAITAALFLKRFVGKIPWAHLDIAGPAWAEKPISAYAGAGAVGFGVRTVVEYFKIT
jgi:leucyl aminopeptidase